MASPSIGLRGMHVQPIPSPQPPPTQTQQPQGTPRSTSGEVRRNRTPQQSPREGESTTEGLLPPGQAEVKEKEALRPDDVAGSRFNPTTMQLPGAPKNMSAA